MVQINRNIHAGINVRKAVNLQENVKDAETKKTEKYPVKMDIPENGSKLMFTKNINGGRMSAQDAKNKAKELAWADFDDVNITWIGEDGIEHHGTYVVTTEDGQSYHGHWSQWD